MYILHFLYNNDCYFYSSSVDCFFIIYIRVCIISTMQIHVILPRKINNLWLEILKFYESRL